MMPNFKTAIVYCRRVVYYKPEIKTKGKLHMTLGHQTVMGVTQFFSTSFEESKVDLDNEEQLIEHFNNDVLPKVCDYEDVLLRQGPKAPLDV
jgi:hypothetical protein